jgi:hypothetical protein
VAYAHTPTFNQQGSPSPEQAFVIDDVGLSLALFGTLREYGAADYYRLDVPDGHSLDFNLFVPMACEDFRPEIALIGPEVAGNSAAVDLEIPPDMNISAVAREQWGSFFEPFDPAFYFRGPGIRHIADGGTYYIVVYSTQDEPGNYMLGMSGREEFSAGDNWREQKSEYDRCEIGANNWFWRQWQKFLGGGVLLLIPFLGYFLARRRGRL